MVAIRLYVQSVYVGVTLQRSEMKDTKDNGAGKLINRWPPTYAALFTIGLRNPSVITEEGSKGSEVRDGLHEAEVVLANMTVTRPETAVLPTRQGDLQA